MLHVIGNNEDNTERRQQLCAYTHAPCTQSELGLQRTCAVDEAGKVRPRVRLTRECVLLGLEELREPDDDLDDPGGAVRGRRDVPTPSMRFWFVAPMPVPSHPLDDPRSLSLAFASFVSNCILAKYDLRRRSWSSSERTRVSINSEQQVASSREHWRGASPFL